MYVCIIYMYLVCMYTFFLSIVHRLFIVYFVNEAAEAQAYRGLRLISLLAGLYLYIKLVHLIIGWMDGWLAGWMDGRTVGWPGRCVCVFMTCVLVYICM